jgi:hypothetical protein
LNAFWNVGNVGSKCYARIFIKGFDRDGNGRLDASEFLQLQSCLSADGQRSSVFSRADSNQDGCLESVAVRSIYDSRDFN